MYARARALSHSQCVIATRGDFWMGFPPLHGVGRWASRSWSRSTQRFSRLFSKSLAWLRNLRSLVYLSASFRPYRWVVVAGCAASDPWTSFSDLVLGMPASALEQPPGIFTLSLSCSAHLDACSPQQTLSWHLLAPQAWDHPRTAGVHSRALRGHEAEGLSQAFGFIYFVTSRCSPSLGVVEPDISSLLALFYRIPLRRIFSSKRVPKICRSNHFLGKGNNVFWCSVCGSWYEISISCFVIAPNTFF